MLATRSERGKWVENPKILPRKKKSSVIDSNEEASEPTGYPCSITSRSLRQLLSGHRTFFLERAGDFWILGEGSQIRRSRSLILVTFSFNKTGGQKISIYYSSQ